MRKKDIEEYLRSLTCENISVLNLRQTLYSLFFLNCEVLDILIYREAHPSKIERGLTLHLPVLRIREEVEMVLMSEWI